MFVVNPFIGLDAFENDLELLSGITGSKAALACRLPSTLGDPTAPSSPSPFPLPPTRGLFHTRLVSASELAKSSLRPERCWTRARW